MTLYLEQYLDSLQGLPGDLKRNLSALRRRDEETQAKLKDLDAATKAYLKGQRGWSKEMKGKKYETIRTLFREARNLADDKVALAANTYEMVDKHIRRLDTDLSRFENDIKRKFLEGKFGETDDEAPPVQKKGRKSGAATPAGASGTKKGAAVSAVKKRKLEMEPGKGPPSKKKRKGGRDSEDEEEDLGAALPAALAELTGPALFQQLAGGGGEVLDMPVDPNEPTYCLCHQVSFGEMVGCDNTQCPIEWFHFACVGLQAKPKGKWFCPKCTEERKKKAH